MAAEPRYSPSARHRSSSEHNAFSPKAASNIQNGDGGERHQRSSGSSPHRLVAAHRAILLLAPTGQQLVAKTDREKLSDADTNPSHPCRRAVAEMTQDHVNPLQGLRLTREGAARNVLEEKKRRALERSPDSHHIHIGTHPHPHASATHGPPNTSSPCRPPSGLGYGGCRRP